MRGRTRLAADAVPALCDAWLQAEAAFEKSGALTGLCRRALASTCRAVWPVKIQRDSV